jgi:rSAM/selenodomain-associated transferase 1
VRTVVLFARAPSAAGKTRLTGHLPVDRACGLREALLLDTLDAVRAVGEAVLVSFTPEDRHAEMAALVGSIGLVAQRGVDLGQRMYHAMGDAFSRGAKNVALVGSDLPLLPSQRLVDAFVRLESGSDVVFGPSTDGGFYLVGARRRAPGVFDGIEWGTERVLAGITAASRRKQLQVALLEPWWDVDGPEDLRRIMEADGLAGGRVRRWCAANGSLFALRQAQG